MRYTCKRNNVVVNSSANAEDVIKFLAENDPFDEFSVETIEESSSLICSATEHTQRVTYRGSMNVRNLIKELQKYNPDAIVKLMGSIQCSSNKDDLDDVQSFDIISIHDEWTLGKSHDMVSLEFIRGTVLGD